MNSTTSSLVRPIFFYLLLFLLNGQAWQNNPIAPNENDWIYIHVLQRAITQQFQPVCFNEVEHNCYSRLCTHHIDGMQYSSLVKKTGSIFIVPRTKYGLTILKMLYAYTWFGWMTYHGQVTLAWSKQKDLYGVTITPR